ncbi:MAG: hydroxyneurosporene methyltransferase [Pseudomonadota bacterium]|jgi:demethylspheroidene O-methyltransferase
MLGKRSWRDWRNQWVMSPRFQRWAAAFPLTRSIARLEAREMFDVVAGFVYSQVVLACLRLGLLERLRAGAVSESELQVQIDLPPAALRTLLRAAAALELLELRDPGVAVNREHEDPSRSWGLGLRGAALLGNPGVLAMIEHHAVLYADLVDPLAMLAAPRGSTGLAQYWPYAAVEAPGAVASDSTRAYTRLMSASQQLVAGEILDAYAVRGHRCVLDVGGGDGTFLRALAARAPEAQLMLFDLPGVAAQAESAFAAAGLAAKARVLPGDFSRDALPTGADLITFVRVLHDHDDPRVERMLRAAYEALPPGGRLLVAEPLAGTAGAGRMGDAYFGVYLWAMGSGRPRTAAELTDMLRAAGFRRIRRRPTRIPLQTSVLVAERG